MSGVVIPFPAMEKERPNRINHWRTLRGWTMEDLALRADTSSAQISNLENGKRPLTIDWMRRLALALRCTPADLLSEADNPRKQSPERSAWDDLYDRATPEQREMVRHVAEGLLSYNAPMSTERRRA